MIILSRGHAAHLGQAGASRRAVRARAGPGPVARQAHRPGRVEGACLRVCLRERECMGGIGGRTRTSHTRAHPIAQGRARSWVCERGAPARAREARTARSPGERTVRDCQGVPVCGGRAAAAPGQSSCMARARAQAQAPPARMGRRFGRGGGGKGCARVRSVNLGRALDRPRRPLARRRCSSLRFPASASSAAPWPRPAHPRRAR